MKTIQRRYLSIAAWENAEPEYEKPYDPNAELPEKYFDDTPDKEMDGFYY